MPQKNLEILKMSLRFFALAGEKNPRRWASRQFSEKA